MFQQGSYNYTKRKTMKNFRDELLQVLFDHAGDWIDLTQLVAKYCGEGNTFDNGDETKIKCRLNINLDLIELREKMEWINLSPQNGLSAAHKFNHDIGKREFILDYPVKARMTHRGQVEYKKSKESDIKHNVHIGGDFTGVLLQNSDVSNTNFRPEINPANKQNIADKNMSLWAKFKKLIFRNIEVIIGLVVAGLLVAYLAYRFHWVG